MTNPAVKFSAVVVICEILMRVLSSHALIERKKHIANRLKGKRNRGFILEMKVLIHDLEELFTLRCLPLGRHLSGQFELEAYGCIVLRVWRVSWKRWTQGSSL